MISLFFAPSCVLNVDVIAGAHAAILYHGIEVIWGKWSN